jgi:hypothetical protein
MSTYTRSRFHRPRDSKGGKVAMAPQRILGFVLLAAGAALLAFGMSTAHAAGAPAAGNGPLERIENWYVFVGLGIALVGFILAVIGHRRAKKSQQ